MYVYLSFSRDFSKLFIKSFFFSGETFSSCIFRIFSMISFSAIFSDWICCVMWSGWSLGRLLIVDAEIIMSCLAPVLTWLRSLHVNKYPPDLFLTESWRYFCSINAVLVIFVVTNDKGADQPMSAENRLCQPMRARYGDCCRSPP